MWRGYAGGWPMLVGAVLLWGSIIGLVAWAIHRLSGRRDDRPHDGHRKSPMDLLKERYARGEISKQEYEELRRDLLA